MSLDRELNLIDVYFYPTPNQVGPVKAGRSVAIETANDYTLAVNLRRLDHDDPRRELIARRIIETFPHGTSMKSWAEGAIINACAVLGAKTFLARRDLIKSMTTET